MPRTEPHATKLIQKGLIASGYPLPRFGADGQWGQESEDAFSAYVRDMTSATHVGPLDVAVGAPPGTLVMPETRFPTDDINHLFEFYGRPNMAKKLPPSGIKKLDLPYPMELAWGDHQIVKKVSAHEKVHASLYAALERILDTFGPDGIKRFRLDQLGGILNVRFMRGSSNRISRHAFGIAIDIDPEHNGLKTPWPLRAAMPIEAVQCFEAEGWTSFARVRGIDAMHFQATSNYVGN